MTMILESMQGCVFCDSLEKLIKQLHLIILSVDGITYRLIVSAQEKTKDVSGWRVTSACSLTGCSVFLLSCFYLFFFLLVLDDLVWVRWFVYVLRRLGCIHTNKFLIYLCGVDLFLNKCEVRMKFHIEKVLDIENN